MKIGIRNSHFRQVVQAYDLNGDGKISYAKNTREGRHLTPAQRDWLRHADTRGNHDGKVGAHELDLQYTFKYGDPWRGGG